MLRPFRERETMNEQLLREAGVANEPGKQRAAVKPLRNGDPEAGTSRLPRTVAGLAALVGLAGGLIWITGATAKAVIVPVAVALGWAFFRYLLDRIRNPHGRY